MNQKSESSLRIPNPSSQFVISPSPSACVLFDRHAVVHLINPKNLRLAAVTPELVILAHDERLHRFGWTDLRAQPAEAASRQVEVEVVEDFDLLARFTVTTQRDEVVRTRFRALI